MDIFSIIFAVILLIAVIIFANLSGVIDLSKYFSKKRTQEGMHKDMMKVLRRLSTMKNFEIMENVKLSFNGETFHFDAVILGFWGTIALKANYLSGEVYGQDRDENWTHIENNIKSRFENPLKQLNGSVRFFKDIYRTEKVKCGLCESFVIFASKNIQLYDGKRCAALTLKQLYPTFSKEKYLVDNGADVDAMKKALEKYTVK